jgi:hypothetical protein
MEYVKIMTEIVDVFHPPRLKAVCLRLQVERVRVRTKSGGPFPEKSV